MTSTLLYDLTKGVEALCFASLVCQLQLSLKPTSPSPPPRLLPHAPKLTAGTARGARREREAVRPWTAMRCDKAQPPTVAAQSAPPLFGVSPEKTTTISTS